jgi:altronate dehydratase small subunit
MTDRYPAGRLLKLSPTDNVAVATSAIAAGEVVDLEGTTIAIAEDVPLGHKVAMTPIAVGEKIRKYGCPIGSATCNISPGRHVHTHNMKSDYLPTFAPPNKSKGSAT